MTIKALCLTALVWITQNPRIKNTSGTLTRICFPSLMGIYGKESLAWDIWPGNFGLESLIRDLGLEISGLGSLDWDIWLGISG